MIALTLTNVSEEIVWNLAELTCADLMLNAHHKITDPSVLVLLVMLEIPILSVQMVIFYILSNLKIYLKIIIYRT